MKKRQIIPEEDIQGIVERLKNGATFTAIASEYGVKAWTIQKRVGRHPLSGKRTAEVHWLFIWQILPNYQKICLKIASMYKNPSLYDFCSDYLLSVNFKTFKKIESWEEKNREYYTQCLLCSAIAMRRKSLEVRNTVHLYEDEHHGNFYIPSENLGNTKNIDTLNYSLI